MDSDDDFTSLSPPSPLLHRRLKRLKKSAPVPNSPLPPESTDEIYSEPGRIFDSSDSLTPESLDATTDELERKGERKETKRVLDFDDVEGEIDLDLDLNLEGSEKTKEMEFGEINGDLNVGGSEKKLGKVDGEEGLSDNNNNKKKKKRSRSGGDDDGKAKSSVSNRRREEKERKIYLQQLHAESQKLLRETRDATFKPIPVVHKPISSILEKIRQRKLELIKNRTGGQNRNCTFLEKNASFREVTADDDSENVSREREADQSEKVLHEKTVPCENNSDYSLENNGVEKALAQSEDDDSPRMAFDEPTIQPFRAPVDDTQDLFPESETSEGKEDAFGDENNSLLEEEFVPSLLAMNLKFDSAPPDDSSSEEEDNDKENVLPKGDPVKAFIDEEAEEEDDSDHDIRFQENEEENYEDYEELKDLIATGNEENPLDNDKRNELHQKWLEQQDATGTDNLMQRLKYGVKLKEKNLFEDEQEEDLTDDEEFCDEAAEYPLKSSVARKNRKKAKLMIPQLFSDKNDGYLSSDEEETEKRLTKQRVLDKVEKQSMLVPPAEDENSREVFGLIKKLNIVPDTKKKAKPSFTGANTNVFSKSSFVGRKGNHSVPSSHKQGTSTIRSFIFGRDDSNSRSSLSISEDSSDVIIDDTPPTRNVTTKFSSSQFKFSSQITKTTTNTATGPSLFEYLKQSSIKSNNGKQEITVGLTQTVYAAFKIPKKPLKIERRF